MFPSSSSFFALSDFLHSVDALLGKIARYSSVGLLAVYLTLSLVPLIVKNSPYQTALTTPLQACSNIIRSSFHLLLRPFRHSPNGRVSRIWGVTSFPGSIHVDRARVLMKETKRRASTLDRSAMHWLLQELDEDDMDVFLKGLPGYIHSPVTDTKMLIEGLAADGFLWRIREHFTTCVVSPELGEDERMSRAVACADSLQMISETAVSLQAASGTSAVSPGPVLEGGDIETIMQPLVPFCSSLDHTVALRASCVMGLTILGLLASLERSDPQDTAVRTFPGYLLPLYYTIRSWKTLDVSRWTYSIISTATIHPPPSDQEMWSDLLHDGPLINLAVLANALLSRFVTQDDYVPMSWETMNVLIEALNTIHAQAPPMTQSRFHDVHSRVRSSAKNHEGDRFYISQLLEILDMVARGLRLSEVFACTPRQRQVGILFGLDQLDAYDLLEAFVAHLPRYIASTPSDVSRALLERIVTEDQLWAKLHSHLSKCFLYETPSPEKGRIVNTFHNLLDELFVILEGSPNINWHVPELDLLIEDVSRYDKEVARSTFFDSSLVYRDNFFRAQFFHASLAQFARLRSRGDSLNMYSIHSLLQICDALETGEEYRTQFSISPLKPGASTMPGLRVAAEDMVISLLRDGPLSSFHRLGKLSFDMVQDETGETVSENVKKTWKLLEKIIDSTLLPMGGASPRIWSRFKPFRDSVRSASTAASPRGREHLLPLLEMINRVDALPRSTPDENSTDDDSEDEAPTVPTPYYMPSPQYSHYEFIRRPMYPSPWTQWGLSGHAPDVGPATASVPRSRRRSISRRGSPDFVPPNTERFDSGYDSTNMVDPGGLSAAPHDDMDSMDPGDPGSNMPPVPPPHPFPPPRRRHSGFGESPPSSNRNRSSLAPIAEDPTPDSVYYVNDRDSNDE
ncbi:hypothetical protein BC834DRAFT_461542 [Gloeopeniophorella convolvens]|nr:hypothetical protein BC834DRAFT_461542 [Gloeopeniophorella convolvens]